MERTISDIIGAPFLQFHKRAHYIDDIDTAEDLLYGILWDQAFFTCLFKQMYQTI